MIRVKYLRFKLIYQLVFAVGVCHFDEIEETKKQFTRNNLSSIVHQKNNIHLVSKQKKGNEEAKNGKNGGLTIKSVGLFYQLFNVFVSSSNHRIDNEKLQEFIVILTKNVCHSSRMHWETIQL